MELLALIDVLAVPNVCGSDVQKTSNFSIKPVRLSVYTSGAADLAAVPPLPPLMPSQRTPADFKVKRIKAERELVRDLAYVPEFTNVPIIYSDFPIRLDAQEYAQLRKVRRTELYGDDDGAALRDVLFS